MALLEENTEQKIEVLSAPQEPIKSKGISFYLYPLIASTFVFLGIEILKSQGVFPFKPDDSLATLETSLKKVEAQLTKTLSSDQVQAYLDPHKTSLENELQKLSVLVESQKEKIQSLESALETLGTRLQSTSSKQEAKGEEPPTALQAPEVLTLLSSTESAVRKGEDFQEPLQKLIEISKGFPEMGKLLNDLRSVLTTTIPSDDELVRDLQMMDQKHNEKAQGTMNRWLEPLLSLVTIRKKGDIDSDKMTSLIRSGKIKQVYDFLLDTPKTNPTPSLVQKLKDRLYFEYSLRSMEHKLRRRFGLSERATPQGDPS